MPEILFLSLLFVFILATALQLAFGFLFLKRRAVPSKTQRTGDCFPDISVLICARNEADNLARFLPAILNQSYEEAAWEVIVVNDGATEDMVQVLASLQQQYDRLRVYPTDREATPFKLPGKKAALHTGITHARYNTLLLTDADCRPATSQWIKSFGEEKAKSGNRIILGYGAYLQKPGLLNKCIRWETIHTAMQYFSFARWGRAYMGVGRNLMYEKSLYQSCINDPSFRAIYQKTLSGDDDLLVANMSTKDNTGIILSARSHTQSLPPATWGEWWRQKSRHVTTGKYYPAGIKRYLGIFALSHALFWCCGIILLVTTCLTGNYLVLVPILFLFLWRTALYWINAHNWQESLHESQLRSFFPLGDFGWAIYNVFLSPFIFWKGNHKWK